MPQYGTYYLLYNLVSISALKSFYHVHVAMKVKFALEQPSSMGVGHELASQCCAFMHVLRSVELTHKATCKGPGTLMSMTTH